MNKSEYQKKYYQENKEKLVKYQKEYREKNKEVLKLESKEYNRKYYNKNREKILLKNNIWFENNPNKKKEYSSKSYKKMLKEYPWKQHWKAAEQRCNNPNRTGYKSYGDRGIKFLLDIYEIELLWYLYEADKLEKPSIDRIDPDGDYTIDNCRFIEMKENCKNVRISRNKKGQFESLIERR